MPIRSAVEIFNDALSVELEGRLAFVEEACGGDSRLFHEIASLLAFHDGSAELPFPDVEFQELQPGAQLGSFVILEELGRGGMGIIYLAEDRRLRRRLAIKTLSNWIGQDADRLALLLREAQVLASLKHPNIGVLHALEESEGICYLVLELVEGQTLSHELRSGPMSPGLALHLCGQIAAGLDSAHRSGVIHRDLKPANVMVTPDRWIKLVDFGLAKVLFESDPRHALAPPGTDAPDPGESSAGRAPAAGTDSSGADTFGGPSRSRRSFTFGVPGGLAGTPGYMSPEQLLGHAVDHRVDVWSFGCILCECLVGEPAFPGRSPGDRIARTLSGPPDWTRIPANVPARILELLRSCLSADPNGRPDSMAQLLPYFQDGHGSAPRPLRPDVGDHGPGKAFRPSPRSWIAAIAVLALVAVLAAAFGGLLTPFPRRAAEVVTPLFRQVSFDGDVFSYAISPDGSRIAFSTLKQDVTVRDLKTGEERRWPLRRRSYVDWSPVRDEILTVLAPYLGSDVIQTVALPADEEEPRPIGPPGFLGMSWSPDGSKVVGVVDEGRWRTRIAILDVATGHVTLQPLIEEFGPVQFIEWSPAGPRFLVKTSRQGSWILDERGEILEHLPNGFACWGPDGASLLLVAGADWRGLSQSPVDMASGRISAAPTFLCDIPEGWDPVVSRNGRVCILRNSNAMNLWRLDLENEGTSPPWRRYLAGTRNRFYPRISPDGSRLACVEDEGAVAGRAELVLYDLTDPRQVPRVLVRSVVGTPAWSPDGSEIAIQKQVGESGDLWVVRADGQSARSLERSSKNDQLGWVPGRGVFFQPEGNPHKNFEVVDPETGRSSMLFREPTQGTAYQTRPSPDGTRVAVAGNRGGIPDVRTWIIDLRDGSETLLWSQWAGPVGWSLDSESVYVIAEDPDHPGGWQRSLFLIPARGGQPKFLTDCPGSSLRFGGVDISSDGLTVFCEDKEGRSDLWLLEGLTVE